MGLFSRSNRGDKMTKLAEVAGYTFHYATRECDRPCVVVSGNGGSARILLAPIEVTEHRDYCRPEIDQIRAIASQHETAWVENWDRGAAA